MQNLKFNAPKNQSSIIKVLGVGGGGSNAVNHMFNQGIKGVDFVICNTDAQALNMSNVPTKIQLGVTLSEGMGAGSDPEVGKQAALENIEDIKEILENNTKMLFITAGMGGGTGTGGAPIIAEAAKNLGILTVAIITIPFSFEGRKRALIAEEGIKELKKHVDTILIICNDRLRDLYGNLKLSEAFHNADNVLATAAKGIAEIITVPGYINVDFKDVNTVMKNSGVAIMGSGIADGENRAIAAVEQALSSPLLNDNDIDGASDILLYIASGEEDEVSMDEVTEITNYIQNKAGINTNTIWGTGKDKLLDNKISITLIATGFNKGKTKIELEKDKIVHRLEEDSEKDETKIIDNFQKEEKLKNSIKLIRKKTYEENSLENFQVKETIYNKDNEVKPENKITEHVTLNKEEDPGKDKLFFKTKLHLRKTINLRDNQDNVLSPLTNERIMQIKKQSQELKTKSGLERIERIPAYIRRNVKLQNIEHSLEDNISHYTLSEKDDNTSEIKTNNSFLHDNVD